MSQPTFQPPYQPAPVWQPPILHQHFHYHGDQVVPAIAELAHQIHEAHQQTLALLNLLLKKENTTMADLTALTAAVANETTIDNSAIALLNGLKAALDSAGTDPAALAALSDSLSTEQAALAAAVAANTPAAPAAPAPVETPAPVDTGDGTTPPAATV